jgi:hypothetical protein
MTINVNDSTKSEWDELKPDDYTHDEFAQELLETYRMQDTELLIDELVNRVIAEIDDSVATKAELAAYRGTKDAIESTVIE